MWDFVDLEDGRWYLWRLNGAAVAVRRTGNEWKIALKPARLEDLAGGAGGPEIVADGDVDLPRDVSFAIALGKRVSLRPAMPELPYLVTVKDPVNILSGAEAAFTVDLPVVFRAETEHGELLRELAPFTLSKTWFGDTSGGTLCWSLPAALDPGYLEGSSEHGGVTVGPSSLASCRITVRNRTRSSIELRRMAVYVELLRIWEVGGRLVTDGIVVDSLPDGGLKMSVADGTPPDGKLLSQAKVGQRELLVRRGVAFLRTIAGI